MVSVDASLVLISIQGVSALGNCMLLPRGFYTFGTIEDRLISWEFSSLGNLGSSSLDLTGYGTG